MPTAKHSLMKDRPAPMPTRAERERAFRRHWRWRHSRDQRRHLDRTLARAAFFSLCHFIHARRPKQIARWEGWARRTRVYSTLESRALVRREIAEAFSSLLANRGATHRPTDRNILP